MDSYAQSLCIQEANRQGCPTDIALATVEAETGGKNVLGDNGNAIGFGQVWERFHWDAFQYAANLLGLPPPPQGLSALQQYTLANDQFSMAVAVRVIHQDWQSSGGDWLRFTKEYVGAGVSTPVIQYREAIWNKYHGSAADYTGQAQIGAQSSSRTAQTNGPQASGLPAFYGPLTNLTLPEINVQVVPGSAAKGDVLYGRKYQVIVSDLAGDTALDVSELHVQFSITQTILTQPPYSTVTIYNLSPETENAIIQEGYRCIVSAGYTGSQYGQIADLNVIQPVRYKQNGTDYVLQLVGMPSDLFYAYGFANFSLLRGQNSRQVIEHVASRASIPTEIGILSSSLSTKGLSRGKVVFGMAADILRQIAKSEGMAYYMADGKINFLHPTDSPTTEAIDLTPATGLLGVPTQQGYSVTAKMLLNPRISIGSMVHIDNSLVRNQQYAVGQPIYQLDHDGLYRVTQFTHAGDSRGDEWSTTIEAVSQIGTAPNMISSGAQNPF